ncbi:MAG: HupE/UreJ family protein [Clostridiales bacterium]|nr:HupE/UreJ family protein [Clostridiales bacterium]
MYRVVPFLKLGIVAAAVIIVVTLAVAPAAFAHGVASADQIFIAQTTGAQVIPFIYLGAKHMVTGYDHLLFLVGVIFFLHKMRDVWHYVTLFAIGHSVTLILGVLVETNVSAYMVDAIIGLSVAYKALDNVGGLKRMLGFRPDPRMMVLGFGFIHGFGLATQFLEYDLAREGLVANLLAFNVGVEIGQVLALAAILVAMNAWRRSPTFERHAFAANMVLMTAGFVLTGYQLAGLFAG